MLPLIYKQHEPNFSEKSLAASGLSEGKVTREDKLFRDLVPNYNPDIIFKDEEGTGADRLMTQRCKEKLNTLAISVMNQWPGVRLRVTEAWDEEDHHARNSLHYEGRAVDVTTSDRDRRKYGLLASLAVEAGFDWVYYESRSHVHLSCRAESAGTDKHTGCFTGESKVLLESGRLVNMSQVREGDSVQSLDSEGNVVWSEVLMFMDREPEEVMRFIKLSTEAGSDITLTPSHLIYHGAPDCGDLECLVPGYAGNVQVGDRVMVTRGGERRLETVVSVSVTRRRGVYAPLTRAGNIVVDSVLASCYAVIDSQSIAHIAFAPVRWYHGLSSWVSGHDSTPRSAVSSSTGVHWYPNMLYSLARLVMPSHLVL